MSHENLYLSVDQVAARFDVSKDSIWRWKRQGDFPPPVKLGGNTSRWRLADIEEWEGQLKCGLIAGLNLDVDAMLAR
jgi:prophage regulatory protein